MYICWFLDNFTICVEGGKRQKAFIFSRDVGEIESNTCFMFGICWGM